MSDQLLTIEATRLDAGHVRLRLTGDLDFDTAPELTAAAADLHGDEVLIDLSGVSICDSSGLSALLVVQRKARVMQLTGVSPQLQRMLDRTGLAEVLAVDRDDLRATG
ncbi:STAS domain-containing protein [Micromonospora sp. WMMD967]|uniref:STAS domain-containing protein n=1 Tax=Micromonospora sp. WMMD967 TaxID=3016101 RepID=UPI002415B694|nr:STAS domain-containing protein [Micromonospora sp. WMMD967]MDG4838975.1 STAS domain-containing protein [Micromonospora sp. WMMD967]